MKLSKIIFILSSTVLLNASCNGQSENKLQLTNDIQWMSFEQAVAKSNVTPKKIFIDISTSWCGWCKKMDASTFKDTSIIRYMNDHYYAVRLDAETHDTIHFQDKLFVFKPEYKANELALSLLSGQMSYPSFIFMDEKFVLLSPLAGYQTVPQLEAVMKYFGANIFKDQKWEDYQKSLGN